MLKSTKMYQNQKRNTWPSPLKHFSLMRSSLMFSWITVVWFYFYLCNELYSTFLNITDRNEILNCANDKLDKMLDLGQFTVLWTGSFPKIVLRCKYFAGTVSTCQFYFTNSINSTVPVQELYRDINSCRGTVPIQ